LIKGGEDGIGAGGRHRGHIEHVPDLGSATAHVAWGVQRARVFGERRDPDQSGHLGVFNLTEFRHVSQDRGREDRADAGDLLQALRLGPQVGS